MRGLHIPLAMGMNPSLYDIFRDLVFTMTLTFVALGGINLVIAADLDAPNSLLRRVAWFNAIWGAAFLIMNWIYQIPPPLISAVVIEAAIVASVFTLPRSQRQ